MAHLIFATKHDTASMLHCMEQDQDMESTSCSQFLLCSMCHTRMDLDAKKTMNKLTQAFKCCQSAAKCAPVHRRAAYFVSKGSSKCTTPQKKIDM